MNDTDKSVVDILKNNRVIRILTSNVWLASCYGVFLFAYELKFLREIVSFLHPILILWSMLVIVCNCLKYRRDRSDISRTLLVIFVVLAGITAVLNYETGLVSNIKAWILAVIPLGVFYPMCILTEKNRIKKNFIISLIYPSFIVFIASLISLIMFFLRISQTVQFMGVEELIGFRYYFPDDPSSGLLLYGVYMDTNHAAIYSLVFAMFSIFLFRCCRKKVFKHEWINRGGMIYAAMNFIVQICYFPLANSRGAWLSLCFAMLVVIFLYGYTKKFKEEDIGKKLCKSFLTTFVCVTIVFGGLFCLRGILVTAVGSLESYISHNNVYHQEIQEESEEKYVNDDSAYQQIEEQSEVDVGEETVENIPTENNFQTDKIEKKEETKESFTKKDRGNGSGRLVIWKEALLLFQKKPVFGIAPGNGQYYVEKLNVASEKIANGFVLHNSYLDVLIDYGVIGFSVFISFLGVCAWKILKRIFGKKSILEVEHYIIMCVLLLIAAASFFLTCVFVNVTAMYYLFLIMLGYLMSCEE